MFVEVMSSWVMGAGRSPVGLRLQRFGTISKEERASLVAQLVKNPPAYAEYMGSIPGLRRSHLLQSRLLLVVRMRAVVLWTTL